TLAAGARIRGDALEIRRGEALVIVPSGETIDDTIVAFGESVSIDGEITGDLIVFARRVSVRGRVGGDLVAFAEIVTVEGGVGSNVYGFARDVTLAGATIGANVYGFANDVAVRTAARVGGNAALLGNTVAMHGRIGRDLVSFASGLELGGEVGRNVQAFGQEMTLLPQARIGGDLISHLPSESSLRRSEGAMIGGIVDARVEEREEPNRYLTASFYVRQALWLGAAFLTGL